MPGRYSAIAGNPVPREGAKDKELLRIDLGGALGFNLNSTASQYTTTETRFGLGVAANAEFHLGEVDFAFFLAFLRNQSLAQSQDGAANTEICKEGFGTKFIGFPGPCGQIQVRMQPVLWVGNWGGGMSITFNHIANYTYKEEIIYNTKWNYLALGVVAAYRIRMQSITLMPAVHFDYGIDSSTMVAQAISAWQMGVNIYAMYAIY